MVDGITFLIILAGVTLAAVVGYRIGRDSAQRDTARQVADLRNATRHYRRERDRLASELADLRAYIQKGTRS